jgi:hypothetical protein
MRICVAAVLSVCIFLSGCGGDGGSSDSNSLSVQGTLTERAGHKAAPSQSALKHAAGKRIGGVKVCIREQCSITDDEGQFGLSLDQFEGGAFTVSLDGHGINTSVVASASKGVREVSMDLGHANGVVTIESLTFDGVDR